MWVCVFDTYTRTSTRTRTYKHIFLYHIHTLETYTYTHTNTSTHTCMHKYVGMARRIDEDVHFLMQERDQLQAELERFEMNIQIYV